VLELLQNRDGYRFRASNENPLALYWTKPPKGPLELLGYACVHFKLSKAAIPPLALKLVDIDAYIAKAKFALDAAEVQSWREALEGATQPASAPSADGELLSLHMVLRGSKWEIHAKTGGNYQRVDREQLRGWQEDGGGQLSIQASAFLGCAASFLEHWRGATTSPTTEYSRNFLYQLLQHRELRHCVLDSNFEPITRDPQPLRWSAEKRSNAQAELSLRLPSGEPLPAKAVALKASDYDSSGRPVSSGAKATLYLLENRVYEGPAKLEGQTRLTLPWQALASEEGISFLLSQQSEMPEEIAERVDTVTPQLKLRASTQTRPSPWGSTQSIVAELEAVDKNGAELRRFTESGWRRPKVPASTAKRSRIQIVDQSQLHDFKPALENFKFKWQGDSWTRSLLDDRQVSDFGAWLQRLPSGIAIELSPDLAGLDRPPVKIGYEIDLQEGKARDWFDVRLVRRVDDTQLSEEEIELLMAARGRFVKLASGQWRRLAQEASPEADKLMKDLGMEKPEDTQRLHTLQLESEASSQALSSVARATLENRINALSQLEPARLPATFSKILRPYQKDGFAFLAQLSQLQFGGMLADDMGLGKTLQALAWLVWLRERKRAAKQGFRALVVCPKSVMDNWLSEPSKFETGLSSTLLQAGAEPANVATKAHITVANYTQLRVQADALLARQWHAVILDEAQYIKNPASQTARVACQLRAEHRLVLTGTPIENSTLDLWSLLRFAMPGALGSQAQFKRLYNPKKDPQALPRLGRRIRPFLLRRSKGQVATDLPERIEEEIYCRLEGPQAKLYAAELKKARQLVMAVKTERQFDKSRFNILQSLLRLRQICCDPQLLGNKPGKSPSAKVQALLDHLQPLIQEGHKILVFSQFTAVLELLERSLAAHEIPTLTLTGKTQKRAELVERFQKPDTEKVFLLSLKAAGSGLNLTAASYVMLFDPWWNPAVEAQAIDRTHRIGQDRQVIAYRLLAKDTIEEKIRSLQKEKSQLASALIDENSLNTTLDLETIRDLLSSESEQRFEEGS